MDTATGTKVCVKCHKDLTSAKRMKDAHGKYWCVECGAIDSQQKKQRGVCADCRGKYPPEQLTTSGEDSVCPGCLAARNKASGGRPGSTPTQDAVAQVRSRNIKLVVAAVLLACGITLITLSILEII